MNDVGPGLGRAHVTPFTPGDKKLADSTHAWPPIRACCEIPQVGGLPPSCGHFSARGLVHRSVRKNTHMVQVDLLHHAAKQIVGSGRGSRTRCLIHRHLHGGHIAAYNPAPSFQLFLLLSPTIYCVFRQLHIPCWGENSRVYNGFHFPLLPRLVHPVLTIKAIDTSVQGTRVFQRNN